ncbi:MAG: hypothetical protein WKG01_16695 [Kofleriaceae bacterium]
MSACPTGSLIEINAYDLFRERSPQMAHLGRTGFDSDLRKKDRKEVLPMMPFIEGVAIRSGGLAKVKRGRYAPLLMWMIGLFAFLVALGEALLRAYRPKDSYMFYELRHLPENLDIAMAGLLLNVKYTPNGDLGTMCGLVGTGLMTVAAIYPIFRRIKAFRWLASNTMWFDFHLMAGTVGPMFIGIHSALKLDSWISAAFWSMVITVVSGFLGRYLYTQVPALSSGVELEELDHERAFQRARPTLTVPMAEIDRELADQRAYAQRVAMSPSVSRALWWLIFQDIGRIPRTWARRGRLSQLGVDRPTRKDLARRAARMIVIARRQVVAPKAQLLLHSWKKVHVPFTVILTGFAVAHIYLSWSRATLPW